MTDLLLQAWVAALIERTKLEWMLGRGKAWKPGERLKLLFAGYNGTRNTGSDVRVEEMLRQVRQVLGAERVQLTVTALDFELTRGYFGDAGQVRLPDLFPPFLYKEVRQHHGVIACEGSMFKSKFANALTTMFIGALGMAAAENKLSVGYGAEAGYMDPSLARLCARYCRHSVVVTRNAESQAVLSALGVESELGTDTAWTFESLPQEYGRKVLVDAGWDGSAPVLIFCPINPFFWPVKASILKWVARGTTGAYKQSHYRGPYFHKSGAGVEANYENYLNAFAKAAQAARQKYRIFPVLVACERLDSHACRAIAERIGGAPVFASNDYNMYELVSILRSGHMMISSRYHGIVTSMPALVPSAGVTMDERIRNLMQERGHNHLLLNVDDPSLGEKLIHILEALQREREAIADGIGRTVVRNLKMMARMGVFLERTVHERYPEFPIQGGLRSWENYLPPLQPALKQLVELYDSRAQAMAAN
jgi:polysaccharide pyruvyl transferase WcaK-like protein